MPGHHSIQARSRLFLAGGLAGLGLLLSGCLGSGSSGGGGNGDGGNGDPGNGAAGPAAIQISTRALNQGVEVSWDGGDGGYTLYWSTDPDFDLDSHASSSDADSAMGVDSPYLVTGLENRRNWYFRVESGDGVVSPVRGALPGPPMPVGNSTPSVMAEGFDHLFIGGRHAGGAILNDSLMAVQRETGYAAQGLGVGGVVRRIVPDGEGGLFVAGQEMEVAGQDGLVFLRLDADYQPDPDWFIRAGGSNEWVRVITVDDDRVYLGGNFTELDGVARSSVAALRFDDGAVESDFDPQVDGTVWAIETLGDRVMIAGNFSTVSNLDQEFYASLNRDGGLVNPQPELNLGGAWPTDMTRFGDAVLLGGGFTDAGPGNDLDYLMQVTADGQVSGVNVQLDAAVWSLGGTDSHLVMVGGFAEANGQARNRFAAFDADLSLLPANPFSSEVSIQAVLDNWQVLRVYGDRAYLVGVEDSAVGVTGGVAEVDLESGLTTLAVAPGAQNPGAVLPVDDDLLLVGGFRGIASGFREPALLAIDAEGNFSEDYRLDIQREDGGTEILAMDAHSDRLYLGGRFTAVDGVSRRHLAAIDSDGRIVNAWSPNPGDDARIEALGVGTDGIYIGGFFNELNSDPEYMDLAGVDFGGTVMPGFDPRLNSDVRSLAFWDEFVAVTGSFNQANDESRPLLAAFDGASGELHSWDPDHGEDASVSVISAGPDGFFIGGEFDGLDQTPDLQNVAYYTQEGGSFVPDVDWTPQPDGPVAAITQHRGTTWIGGEFDAVGDDAQALLAPLNSSGDLDLSRAPEVEGTRVAVIHGFGDLVCFAGQFTRVGGKAFRNFACIDESTGEPAW